MPHGVVSDNRDPNRVVIPPTMKDPYNDLTAIVNRKTTSKLIEQIVSRDDGVSGEAIPMGQLSNMKLK